MKTPRELLLGVVMTLVVAAHLAGTPAKAADPASTSADHAAIAAHYEKEAAAARESAAMHRMMAESYRKRGGSVVEKTHLDQHCDDLAAALEAAAKGYDAMAAAHRELAGKE